MGYRLEIQEKKLILYRNGKPSELYIRKFSDSKIYEWVKHKVLRSPKDQINGMLQAVGIFIKRKVQYGRERVQKKASHTKKISTVQEVARGPGSIHSNSEGEHGSYRPRGTVLRPGEF